MLFNLLDLILLQKNLNIYMVLQTAVQRLQKPQNLSSSGFALHSQLPSCCQCNTANCANKALHDNSACWLLASDAPFNRLLRVHDISSHLCILACLSAGFPETGPRQVFCIVVIHRLSDDASYHYTGCCSQECLLIVRHQQVGECSGATVYSDNLLKR